jgi:hypothetical protein
MSLLAVEILLAVYALTRGWRVAPLLLVALPITVLGFEPALASWLRPGIGDYFDPADTARALAHGFALIGLAVTCWTGPSEAPVALVRSRPRGRRSGPLYQI